MELFLSGKLLKNPQGPSWGCCKSIRTLAHFNLHDLDSGELKNDIGNARTDLEHLNRFQEDSGGGSDEEKL